MQHTSRGLANGRGAVGHRGRMSRVGAALGRTIAIVAVVGLLLFGATGVGLADMRIVEESEGVRTETLFKNNRIASPMPDGSKAVYFCDVGEIMMVSPSNVQRYWRGSLDDLQNAFDSLFAGEGGGESAGDMESLGALLGSLFGAADDDGEETLVRVAKAGEETIAGYAAEHYVVETGSEGNWRVYEEIWVAPGLLSELTTEIGACIDVMVQLQGELLPSMSTGMDELDAVLASPDYLELMERGYPVRTKSNMMLFGMAIETVTETVEVNRDAIGEDVFGVPAGYKQVDHPLEILMFDEDM